VSWRLGNPSRESNLPRPTPHHSAYQLQLLLQKECRRNQVSDVCYLLTIRIFRYDFLGEIRNCTDIPVRARRCHVSASLPTCALLQPSNTTPQQTNFYRPILDDSLLLDHILTLFQNFSSEILKLSGSTGCCSRLSRQRHFASESLTKSYQQPKSFNTTQQQRLVSGS
jgi:hypothetical protein